MSKHDRIRGQLYSQEFAKRRWPLPTRMIAMANRYFLFFFFFQRVFSNSSSCSDLFLRGHRRMGHQAQGDHLAETLEYKKMIKQRKITRREMIYPVQKSIYPSPFSEP